MAADVLPIVVGILIVATAAAFALLPLSGPRSRVPTSVAPDEPERQRFLIYRQVLELEFDYQTGKLSAEDLRLLTSELLDRAASLLREAGSETGTIEDEIEQEILVARRALAAAGTPKTTQGAKA